MHLVCFGFGTKPLNFPRNIGQQESDIYNNFCRCSLGEGKAEFFRVKGCVSREDEAFRQLKRENELLLRMERVILKEEVAIFLEERH
jgi:hypothetical protein